MLQRSTFTTECTRCGWAYPTPRHIMPDCVAEVLRTAKEGRIGASGLQTAERPFQGVLILQCYSNQFHPSVAVPAGFARKSE